MHIRVTELTKIEHSKQQRVISLGKKKQCNLKLREPCEFMLDFRGWETELLQIYVLPGLTDLTAPDPLV